MEYKLILASASPRRKELLAQIGAECEVVPAEGEEHIGSKVPEQVVLELAKQKAKEVAARFSQEPGRFAVLGADTVVAFGGQILGKHKDKADAARMLKTLTGNTQSVFTGVAVVLLANKQVEEVFSFYEETKVTMYPMSEKQIEAYIGTGEPMDKAGAYAIQGKCAVYIEKIAGDYNNVVGLPVAAIYQKLEKSGIEIL